MMICSLWLQYLRTMADDISIHEVEMNDMGTMAMATTMANARASNTGNAMLATTWLQQVQSVKPRDATLPWLTHKLKALNIHFSNLRNIGEQPNMNQLWLATIAFMHPWGWAFMLHYQDKLRSRTAAEMSKVCNEATVVEMWTIGGALVMIWAIIGEEKHHK